MKILLSLFTILFLSACSENVDFSTPAQPHIEEYTAKLKSCQENKLQSSSIINKTDTYQKNIIPAAAISIFDLKATDMLYGNPEAKVKVIEYFSLTCPHCAYFHKKVFPDLKEKYIDTGKIAYVIREFVGSKQDYEGSILARCANDKNKFLHFISLLLDQQENWAFNNKFHEHLVRIGIFGGISEENYKKCLENQNITTTLIENAKKISRFPKFAGTPTFYINGAQYTGAYTFEGLSKIIDGSLQ